MIRKIFGVMASTVLLSWSFASHAGVYVEIPGIPGESNRVDFEGAIDAYGVSGRFADRVCGDILIMKAIDSASPLLIAAAVNAQEFSEITVSYKPDSGDATFPVLTLRLMNARVKSVDTAVDEGGGILTVEKISVRAATMIVEYQVIDDDHSAGEVVSTTLDCRTKK